MPKPELNDEKTRAAVAASAAKLGSCWKHDSHFVRDVRDVRRFLRISWFDGVGDTVLCAAFDEASIYFFFSLVSCTGGRATQPGSASISGESKFQRMKGPEYMFWPVPSIGHHQRPT